MSVTFQIYSFEADEIAKHAKTITSFLIKGYDVPRYKYNIITTPRIKHDLVTDLGVVPKSDSFAIFAFAESTKSPTTIQVENDPTLESAQTTRSKLLELYDPNIINNYTIKYDKSVPSATHQKSLKFSDNFSNSCLGMICLKPQKSVKDYEVTGFVSFFPKLGTLLSEISESFVMNCLSGVENLWITAINEHELRKMYESWGYVFQETVLVPISDDGDVDVDSSDSDAHLESGIGASQDFHLDILVKTFPIKV